ncbi:Zinc finger, C2H2-like [Phytophthora cactorum]|nr:Zinc finger, C2H2-like [Phytophthora cactorum]
MMSLLAQPFSPRTGSALVFSSYEGVAAMAPPAPTQTSSPTAKDRPFVCEEPGCGRRFNRKFTLRSIRRRIQARSPRHKRLHASLKPFECDINGCKRSFPSQEKLDHHIKIHTGRRTHMCRVPGCTKTFSTAGNLTRHTKNRHPELIQSTFPAYPYARASPCTGQCRRHTLCQPITSPWPRHLT